MTSHGMSERSEVQPGASPPGDETARSNWPMFVRLTVMMLLEFVVFGSWFATLGLVLATNKLPTIIGLAYSLAAVAAIVSPMCLGAIGDRFLASQKVLGISQVAGGVVMLFLPSIVRAANGSLALGLIFLYMLFFMPTLGLANSIAFRHLGKNQHLFPYVRVFGTGGWVIAGLLVGALGLSASPNIFLVTAIASFLLGVYSFTLPATPPPAKGVRFSIGDVVGAAAFPLFRHRNFVVFFVCVLLTAISLGVYNSYASAYLGALGVKNVAGVLAIGQISEVACILTIPFVLRRLGMKWALLLGMVCWGIRFAFFIIAASSGISWAVAAIVLQGICNDFFLIIGAMYLDLLAPLEIAAQAQNLLILMISGLGAFVGSFTAGEVYNATVALHPKAGPSEWIPIFLIPIVAAALTAILWTVFFRYRRHEEITRIEFSPVMAEEWAQWPA